MTYQEHLARELQQLLDFLYDASVLGPEGIDNKMSYSLEKYPKKFMPYIDRYIRDDKYDSARVIVDYMADTGWLKMPRSFGALTPEEKSQWH